MFWILKQVCQVRTAAIRGNLGGSVVNWKKYQLKYSSAVAADAVTVV